jgi:hypothetical protein
VSNFQSRSASASDRKYDALAVGPDNFAVRASQAQVVRGLTSCRYAGQYAGTWDGGLEADGKTLHGGHLFGVIEKIDAEKK